MDQISALESYDDLNEFDSDELSQEFFKFADHLKIIASKLDEKTLLSLYGYYKQATLGPCNSSKPYWYNLKAKTKWEAWKKLGNMNQVEAKTLYIKLMKSLCITFGSPSSNEGWVSVSTLQCNEKPLKESEKSIFDYVKEGNLNQVVDILKTGSSLKSWNELDENGVGLIHWAADRGYSDVIEVLLLHGADVNLRDGEMQTPLHYATVCGHFECIHILLKNNADTSLKDDSGLAPIDIPVDSEIKKLFTGCDF